MPFVASTTSSPGMENVTIVAVRCDETDDERTRRWRRDGNAKGDEMRDWVRRFGRGQGVEPVVACVERLTKLFFFLGPKVLGE